MGDGETARPWSAIEPAAPKPSTWAKIGAFVRKYVLAPLPILVIFAVATVLVALGVKNIEIGGLIGKILGRKEKGKSITTANSVPEARKGVDGAPLPVGTPDSRGLTQAPVVALDIPVFYEDQDSVTITDPTGKETKVPLPEGVKPKTVEHVVVVKPEVTEVKVTSTSKVTSKDLDSLLNKLGGK